MSKWIGAIAGNVESLLDKVDQAAGSALHKELSEENAKGNAPSRTLSQWQPPPAVLTVSSTTYSPFLSAKNGSTTPDKPDSVPRSGVRVSSSTPSKLDATVCTTDATSPSVVNVTTAVSSGKDSVDQELFDFLGGSSPSVNGSQKSDGRRSSSSSRQSQKTPELPAFVADVGLANDHIGQQDVVDGSNGQSSGYHSSAEDGSMLQQQLSSVEVENQLLRNEVASLNQEMQSVIRRIQSSNEEVSSLQRKLEAQSHQLSTSEQICRDLRSRESDLQETLTAKETQLDVLRMRFNEADRLLELEKQRIVDLQSERDRLLHDHSSVAGLHSQALDTLQEKLSEAEASLRLETEQHRKTKEEATESESKFDSEKQKMTGEIAQMHRSLEKEKAYNVDLSSQLKAARQNAEVSRQELTEYKEKAARILQSKEKLIASLKENPSSSGKSANDSAALVSELESIRQERDILQDELRSSQHTVDSVRSELAEVENQLQQEYETSRDQISSLEDQTVTEKRRRDDAEIEVSKQKQELRYVHEELIKQKTAFQSRLQDRDGEITRLRNQLTTKTLNASSQEELENRLHSLTETLIQKQAMIEALSTEKSSLGLQLERVEKQYREAEASALRASSTNVAIADTDEARQRFPDFMSESPFDGRVTRRMKMAANVIDRFSIRLGVFLRRYPVARVFVIVYMGLLHLWVMIVLLTYQPEIHGNMVVPHEIQ